MTSSTTRTNSTKCRNHISLLKDSGSQRLTPQLQHTVHIYPIASDLRGLKCKQFMTYCDKHRTNRLYKSIRLMEADEQSTLMMIDEMMMIKKKSLYYEFNSFQFV